MTTLRLDELRQYSDVLRTRYGEIVTVRFVEPRDAEALQNYFRSLTDDLPLQRASSAPPANCRPRCSRISSMSAKPIASA